MRVRDNHFALLSHVLRRYSVAKNDTERRATLKPYLSAHLGGYCNAAVRFLFGVQLDPTMLMDVRASTHLAGNCVRTEVHGLVAVRKTVPPPNKDEELRDDFKVFMQVCCL
jgi:hypothetical protein